MLKENVFNVMGVIERGSGSERTFTFQCHDLIHGYENMSNIEVCFKDR